MRQWSIYALHDPRDRPFYVGVTNDCRRRLREHKKDLGYRPRMVVLETGRGDRIAAERRWIETYRLEGIALINKTAGGNGLQFASAQTRALISGLQKGRPKSAASKAKSSATQKGVPKNFSPDARRRMAVTQFKPGHVISRDVYLANREAIARWWDGLSPEERTERARARSKAEWDARDAKERAAVGRKITAGRLAASTPEERSERARKAALAGVAKRR
jgi:predicted GIY-YIG superfamily endonuclease